MKINLPLRLATLATVTFSSLIPFNTPVKASTFEEQALNQEGVIAIARPYGQNKYDLLIIEQIPDKQACWAESGSNPVLVEPLLLNFDFTGICRRATDSNGYSIRVDGNDLGLDYLLRLVPRGGELVLVGTPRSGNYTEIVLGSTKGLASGFMKVILNPGWQFSKRAYQGKTLGHFYISGSQAAIAGDVAAISTPSVTATSVVNTTATANFQDITDNTYKTEIEKAVAMGFVSGFEDNTFRPQEAVTREQLISMAVDAIGTVYKVDLAAQPQRDMIPFKDVDSDRWSAKKIKWAQWNFLNIGNPNNTLQPTESITRAELIDTMRRMTIHLKNQLNLPREIQQTQEPVQFSDISGSWAQTVITQMSGYCGIATPVNEAGTQFNPDGKATRDYTAAVLQRTIECVKSEAQQASKTTEK
ncbi:MAG TPA: S-layer protein [Cyanothece sp. UBA12306]|nr:S-layer protein [Cyanothece sp. UBA12306]